MGMLAMKYTDEQKQEALNLYVEHGATEAAHLTSIPKRTLLRWATDAGMAQARAKKTEAARTQLARQQDARRLQLQNLLLEKAVDLIQRMDKPHIDFRGKDEIEYPIATSGDVRNYATAAAILIDKFRLERGESTSRTEVTSDDSDIDREVRRLVDELARQPQDTPTG